MNQIIKNISPRDEKHKIKVVIWDLDNTVWEGILLENEDVKLREDVIDIVKTLDARGILNSISSKNDYKFAMKKLKEFGIDKYFIYEQINWNPKSKAVKSIIKSINVSKNAIAFIDDQQFERDEVAFAIPEVLCIDANEIDNILDMPEMNPLFITEDSCKRRHMYLSEIKRKEAEEKIEGSKEDFLASLDMLLTITPAKEEDLKRAEELTVRTNQLNTTGYTYSYDELNQMRVSDKYKLLIAGLSDKYGTYGKIGLVLIECNESVWTLKLLLMSCRVMSRGVGTILLNHVCQMAKNSGVKLNAEFIPNEVNRMMYITYVFSGFTRYDSKGELVILNNDLSNIQAPPEYIKVEIQ